MGMIPITCTHCGGASQIDEAWRGQWVQCPYCAKPTQAAALPPATPAGLAIPPPPPPPVTPPAEARSEAKPQAEAKRQAEVTPAAAAPVEAPAPRAPLTREQRLAIRRRRHLVLAVGGGVLLAVAAYVLFLVSQ